MSGQFLTEDYYVANKLMKGFIGSANIDTNSRLCMSSAVAGHKRAFGEDLVPCSYEDLEQADREGGVKRALLASLPFTGGAKGGASPLTKAVVRRWGPSPNHPPKGSG